MLTSVHHFNLIETDVDVTKYNGRSAVYGQCNLEDSPSLGGIPPIVNPK